MARRAIRTSPNAIYGIPFVVVPGTQPLVPVTFGYDDESDVGAPGRPAGYPLPEQAKTQAGWIEGGNPGNVEPDGDRHMLVVDRDNRILYELYQAYWNAGLNRWEAGSGAVFPLTTNRRRPDTWTSADAAGLAILPGLVRYDEAFGTDPIRHAFRVTVRSTNGYVYPASHRAGSTTGALPMGARLRLKASVNISTYPAYIQRIMQAMKTYGLIVADNGSDMYITGTSDPRWEAYMGQLNSAFNQLNASMFEVVQLGWNPSPAATDSDGDGLPNTWETNFGLDPASNTGVNGASGDPDGDGLTNAQELAGGTHPRGFFKRLFAEGVSNDFFTTRFAALNTGTGAAHVLFRFLRTSGAPLTHAMTMTAQSRITLDPRSVSGMTADPYSTIVESDLDVVVDRTMSWDASGYGSHAETGLAAASTTWFLAEGATHGSFDLFYLIQNPGSSDAQVTVRYLRPAPLAPLEKIYTVGANRRFTIWVDQETFNGQTLLAAVDVSAAITSTLPVVVERSMYMTTGGQPFGAGHESAGVTAASNSWFLAEGATGDFFDMFVLVANPDPTTAATVRATYLLPNGSTLTKDYTVAPSSRFTISVDNETFNGQRLLANAVGVDDPAIDQRCAGRGRARRCGGPAVPRGRGTRRTTRRVRRRPAPRGRWPMARSAERRAHPPTSWWRTRHLDRRHRPRDGVCRRWRHPGANVHHRRQQPVQHRRGRRVRHRGRRSRASARWSRASAPRPRRSSSNARCTRAPAAVSGRPARTRSPRGFVRDG